MKTKIWLYTILLGLICFVAGCVSGPGTPDKSRPTYPGIPLIQKKF